MSYQSIAQLTKDPDFIDRSNACATQQADIYKDDANPEFAALAGEVVKGSAGPLATFVRMAAAGPGVGDRVDVGDGTIDQTLVTDADLLALTQANWPEVAKLFPNG